MLVRLGVTSVAMVLAVACASSGDRSNDASADDAPAKSTSTDADETPSDVGVAGTDEGPAPQGADDEGIAVDADDEEPADGDPSDACPIAPEPVGTRVHEGDLVLSDAASVAAAWSVKEITGDLRFSTSASDLADVSLPNLQRLGGDFNAETTPFVRMHFPNLEEIGGELFLSANLALERTDFRSLTRAGYVYFVRNLKLKTVGMGALREADFAGFFSGDPIVDCLGPVSIDGQEPQSEYREIENDADGDCVFRCGLWMHESNGLDSILSDLDGIPEPEVVAPFDVDDAINFPDVPSVPDLEVPGDAAPESLQLLGNIYLHYPDRLGQRLGHWLAAVRNDSEWALCDLRAQVEFYDSADNSLLSTSGMVNAPPMHTASDEIIGCLLPGEVGMAALSGDPIPTEAIAELHYGFGAVVQQELPGRVELTLNTSVPGESTPRNINGVLINDSQHTFSNWGVDVFALNSAGIPVAHNRDEPIPAGEVVEPGEAITFTGRLYVDQVKDFEVLPLMTR